MRIQAMPSIHRLPDNDQWLLDAPKPKRKAKGAAERRRDKKKAEAHRELMLNQVLCGLDTLAVHYDLLRYPEFAERWPGARYGAVPTGLMHLRTDGTCRGRAGD